MAKKSYSRLPFFLLAGFIGLLVLGGLWLSNLEVTSPLVLEEKNLGKILPTPAAYPKNLLMVPPPLLTAKSYAVVDVDSGVVLLEKDSRIATSPASTTKIMTALVALENYPLGQILEVRGLNGVEGQRIKLVNGERISVENLLYGLLVASANDAAFVLAQNFPGGVEGFVWAMNQKAAELNLEKTHFTNPAGYDDPNHLASAYDLAKLAAEAMKNPEFAKIVATQKITVTDVDGKLSHSFSNVNSLLGKLPGVKGVKTGWTQVAGECLVTFLERDDRKIIISLFGSQFRFKETEEIVNWVFENFTWEDFT
jgi:D-alanyl-D-alanine carboxypeptidase